MFRSARGEMLELPPGRNKGQRIDLTYTPGGKLEMLLKHVQWASRAYGTGDFTNVGC